MSSFGSSFAAEDKPVQSEPPRTANMAGLRRGIPLDVVGAKMGLYQIGMLGTRRRAMIVTSDLWHKRLGHASDDKLPSKIIENKTPYELLHSEKPSYDHMRVLGCLAYYRSIETNGDKFEIRGRPGVFMGYPSGTKGYKIYDPSNGKIITSRDVRFAEKVFPFATKFEQDSAHEMEGRSSAKLSWMEKTGLLNQHDSGRGEFRPKRQESLSINADELGRIRSY
ncbi:putative ribonuclease H-like domain-containing protein [Tanacetum coccineum]